MLHSQIPLINDTIKRTGKAVVAIGCSFVQGQGAIEDILYENYKWEYRGMGYPIKIDVSTREKLDILKQYPNLLRPHPDEKIDFTLMEYKNAFVNVLCEKYFEGEYAPINLGIRGCGNRASIKELYFRPEIDWDGIKDLIVIYMPSGIERFDFVNDLWPEHFHWKAMWPNAVDNPTNGREHLWNGYNKSLYSEKFGVLEQLAHVQELMTWCKLRNARLIVTPGFDRRYNKEYFEHELSLSIERDMDGNIREITQPGFFTYDNSKGHKLLAKLWPWENTFKPEGYQTLADLAMSKEPSLENTNDFFFQFLGNRTPNGWMTPCAHPGVKAHDLYAKLLYNHITTL